MRVAVYIRQLTSLGGGNRYALAVAEHLGRSHRVDVLTHTPIAAARIAAQLNLDLDRVNLRALPHQPAANLAPITAEYDLFINALHNYYIPCQAHHGVIILFFPPQYELDLKARLRRAVATRLGRFLTAELSSRGIFEEEFADGASVRLISGDAEITVAPRRRDAAVTFRVQNPAADERIVHFSIEGERDLSMLVPPHSQIPGDLVLPAGGKPIRLGMETVNGGGVDTVLIPAALDEVNRHLRLADLYIDHPKTRLYQLLFQRLLPHWRDRLLNVPPARFLDLAATYDRVWAISKFTQHWTQIYWNRESDLVYPMIEVENFPPLPKHNQILSVGRFFLGAHNKKHLLMIDVFKALVDQGLSGWTLHLAGGVVDDPVHRGYLERVREAAQGYPIDLHVNAPFAKLKQLYGESAIYWHAAGHGEDEATVPIRLEHFGMTTVEAMAAGCVPVVIRKGGQTEIIDHGRTGFLWDQPTDLADLTLGLIRDDLRRAEMGQAAHLASRRFDRTHFGEQIDQSLAALGS